MTVWLLQILILKRSAAQKLDFLLYFPLKERQFLIISKILFFPKIVKKICISLSHTLLVEDRDSAGLDLN